MSSPVVSVPTLPILPLCSLLLSVTYVMCAWPQRTMSLKPLAWLTFEAVSALRLYEATVIILLPCPYSSARCSEPSICHPQGLCPGWTEGLEHRGRIVFSQEEETVWSM